MLYSPFSHTLCGIGWWKRLVSPFLSFFLFFFVFRGRGGCTILPPPSSIAAPRLASTAAVLVISVPQRKLTVFRNFPRSLLQLVCVCGGGGSLLKLKKRRFWTQFRLSRSPERLYRRQPGYLVLLMSVLIWLPLCKFFFLLMLCKCGTCGTCPRSCPSAVYIDGLTFSLFSTPKKKKRHPSCHPAVQVL